MIQAVNTEVSLHLREKHTGRKKDVQWMQDAVWKEVRGGKQVTGKCALFTGALLPDLRTTPSGS